MMRSRPYRSHCTLVRMDYSGQYGTVLIRTSAVPPVTETSHGSGTQAIGSDACLPPNVRPREYLRGGCLRASAAARRGYEEVRTRPRLRLLGGLLPRDPERYALGLRGRPGP